MEWYWIVVACFIIAVAVGTLVAVAKKQREDEALRRSSGDPLHGADPPDTQPEP